MAKHTKTASRPNVAVTGIWRMGRYGATALSQPPTGKKETTMNSPPIIVSGTIDTMPARMADRYVFSLSTVSGGTTYLFRRAVADLTRAPSAGGAVEPDPMR